MENWKKTKKLIANYTVFVLIIFTCTSCLKSDKLNLKYKSFEPKEIGDGHILSNTTNENIDNQQLEDIYKEIYSDKSLWSMRSLLVFRNGKLVSEAYLKDEKDITNRHHIWSATKQVMGILTGIALKKGYIENLNDPISKYLPTEIQNHSDKAGITIKNLLKMQSGIAFNNDGLTGHTDKLLRQIPENSVEFVLNIPTNCEQGTAFHYNDGDPQLLSAIIQKTTGKQTSIWANEVLFSKLGFTNYKWENYKDGVTFGAFGIETTPRELAKIALCMADSGKWRGEHIFDASWIKDLVTPYSQTENGFLSFGYFWWIEPTRNIYFMWGHGGQYAFIVPDKKLVVIMTSLPNTQNNNEIFPYEALPLIDKISSAAR